MKDKQPIDFAQAAECLKILAHPARLELVQLLLDGRYTVGELAEAVGLAPNVASEHLKLLERCQLLRGEREGRRVYYAIAEPLLGNILGCIQKRFAS